jgi:hypothetical protein
MDLLARYDEPYERLDFGNGIEVRRRPVRPRSRRVPTQQRPFDAAELHLADKEHPDLDNWRTSSLILELADALQKPPRLGGDARVERIRASVRALGLRGLDIEEHLRPGLTRNFALTLGVVVALPAIHARIDPEHPLPDELMAPAEWSDLLSASAQGIEPREFAKALGWAAAASLEEWIAWAPPTSSDWNAIAPRTKDPATDISAWIVDRFTVTYLEDWRSASLRLEWRYVHGQGESPCLAGVMRERRVDADQLAKVIAARFAGSSRRDASTRTSNAYVPTAARYLQEGRRSAAAALFEAIAEQAPFDASAHNNRGFCMIPDSAEDALRPLERAAELGLAVDTLNASNRMHCLYRLGRFATALELAEHVFNAEGRSTHSDAYLWAFDVPSDDPKLIKANTAPHMCELAAAIADAAADAGLAALWRQRCDSAS